MYYKYIKKHEQFQLETKKITNHKLTNGYCSKCDCSSFHKALTMYNSFEEIQRNLPWLKLILEYID